MPGEFLIMPLLASETIPDNVTATQNASGLQMVVGLFQPLPLGFVDLGSDGSESPYGQKSHTGKAYTKSTQWASGWDD